MFMRKRIISILTVIFVVTACSKVPITGRRQLKLIPDSQINEMSNSNYASFLKENPPVNPPTQNSAEVTAVGQKVSNAVERYMNGHGLSDRIKGYKWEFNTVNSQEVNAWCMPGGKVVVYTGILPLTKDDAGLAVVLGHEIAHAIADHGNERMSQQLAIEAAGVGLDIYMQQKPQQTQAIFMTAFGVGSQLGVLAYSRQHELEADRLGLIFMAMAGFNPERAISFWQEMANKGGTKPPEFLSTHPSDEHRIAEIKKLMPEAMKYYQQNQAPSGTHKTGQIKQGSTKTKPNSNSGKEIPAPIKK
jgi:predicted Zn-dependent protease